MGQTSCSTVNDYYCDYVLSVKYFKALSQVLQCIYIRWHSILIYFLDKPSQQQMTPHPNS